MPKLLLLNCSTMMDVDGGGVLFRALLGLVPEGQLVWAVAGGATRSIPPWMSKFPRCVRVSPIFGRRFAGVARRTPLRKLWWWAAYRWFPARAALRIAKFANAHGVERVWVHAGSSGIPTAVRLHRLTGLPMHVSVQDDVAGHVAPEEGAYLLPAFEELLRSASTIDVICSSMRDYYRSRYGLQQEPAIVWTGGDGGPVPPAPRIASRVLRIGYAGNLWAADAMLVLVRAVELLNEIRRPQERLVVVIHAARLPPSLSGSSAVEHRGLVLPEALTRELQACDLLYVPMSFESRYELLCRTSMPAKIVHYMQAQVPILAHGPYYAASVCFVSERGVGFASAAQDAQELAEAILAIERDMPSRLAASRKSRELFETEFSPQAVWSRLSRLLGFGLAEGGGMR